MSAVFSIKRNMIASYIGRAWTGVMGLAFMSVYVRLLGDESYGLIGIYTTLMTVISVLDLGLSTTLNREVARLSTLPGREQESCDLVRTLETFYWGLGLAIGIVLTLASPWIASHWIHKSEIHAAVVQQAVLMMGLIIAVQWPVSLYMGGLAGLQRQVFLNKLLVVIATLQGFGAWLVLRVVPTIEAYFTWQLLVSALQTALLVHYLWVYLPQTGQRPAIRRDLWRSNRNFALGMTGISIAAAILTQLDKIILSRQLPLSLFSYYTQAALLASVLTYLAAPASAALFPRFSQLIAAGKSVELTRLYHQGCQLLSVLVAPVWVTVLLFSRELLALYYGGSAEAVIRADQMHLLLSLIITGTALNVFMSMPFTLQLAYGWTSLSLGKNVIAVIVFVPLLNWMIGRYGTEGAAIMWIAVNGAYVLLEVPFMHRRLLRGEMWRWYGQDVGLATGISLSIGLLARLIIPSHGPVPSSLIYILLTASMMLLACAFTVSATRGWLQNLGTFWRRYPAS